MSEQNKTVQQKRPPAGRGPFGGGPGYQGAGEKPKNFRKSVGSLVKTMRPYLPWVLIAVLFTAGGTVAAILAPTYLGKLTDQIAVSLFGLPIDMTEVAKFGVILAIFYACSMLLNYTQSFIMAGVNQGLSKDLRTRISKKINRLPLKYFDGHATGDTLSRVTNDVDTIGQALNQSFSTLIMSVIMLIGVLIAMFVTCWQLALVIVVTVPVGFALMMAVIKISQKYFKAQQRELGELNGQIEETYSGHNVVKAFNAAGAAEKDFDAINGKLFNSALNAQFLSGLMMPIMGFIGNFGYVAVCAVGATLFVNGTLTGLGVITSFFIYVRLFQNPLANLAQAFNALQSAAAAAERVFDFLGEEEQSDESQKPRTLARVEGRVEFKHARFGYNPDKIIIKDFSASVEPGQKVAIVGPTGAGKTTIVNLLMRFYELNGGEILIDGVPIGQMRREDVRGLFGMVLQDTWLFEGSVKENIVYAKEGVTDGEVVEACKAANIDHFIRTLPKGYDMHLDDDVNISGGQRQLMTIARAMVQNSPMLILDEATSNVDTRTEQLIQDAMDKATAGRTSFVIAHRLSTIKNADLILVMKDGDVIESGSHNRLIEQNGFYAELYNSQFNLEAAAV
ncbi:MAG: ABC transporter ATP-binding protein/permease [Clostridiales bacterium]|jgi:ATP-binding cassette subfamily B protein|nr:ABC transporter ATP-binding protein/permease [Clostridiales bacterium]